jgi:hypothetical protein
MKVLKAKVPVFLNGMLIEPGSKFSCSEELADKFLESKSATLYAEKKSKGSNANDKEESK